MNKKAYTASIPERQISSRKTKVSTPAPDDHSGARGMIFTGTYKDTPVFKQNEDYEDPKKIESKNTKNSLYSELKDMILELA